jgi:hypothetical protein
VRGYRKFIFVFSALFILYILAELNKPEPVDWTVTLSRTDKNPYGAFILYSQLRNIFPNARIRSNRTSVYQQINNSDETNTAYIIMAAAYRPTATTTTELKNYVSKGNYVFATADWFYTPFLDSLGVETASPVSLTRKDSTGVNFVSRALRTPHDYTFLRGTIDQYFSRIDTAKATVLSTNNKGYPVYIKIPYGNGAFFIHTAPLCFSNYFLLFRNNASYASKALSYIPVTVGHLYWDEHEKSDTTIIQTPLRFLLSNEFLRWALRLSLLGILLYVLFEMKRRQRMIPVVEPLKNSTLDFVRTVAEVQLSGKNNHAIANQRITFLLEFIRSRFNISTQELNADFVQQLQRKSGSDKDTITDITGIIAAVSANNTMSDTMLLELSRKIDNFYKEFR